MKLKHLSFPLTFLSIVIYTEGILGYDVSISDADDSRQFCSGMWSGKDTYINVSFTSQSQGQVSMIIYEWSDVEFIGKTSSQPDTLPQKTYICTSDAVKHSLCSTAELGRFITSLPPGRPMNSTSIWTARVVLDNELRQNTAKQPEDTSSGLWNNPQGNPVLPDATDNNYTSLSQRTIETSVIIRQDNLHETIHYSSPLRYPVTKSGYYCAAVVPVSTIDPSYPDGNSVLHPTFKGSILFQNVFQGHLPAADYPKLHLYFAMLLTYTVLGCIWSLMCYKHRTELLPIQYYLSSLVAFIIVQTLASWAYHRYLNSHGPGPVSTVFLFVVAFLDAGRNSLSLFLLLIVSLGLSVVKDSLGSLMTRCWLLAVAHFIFGVLYAVGIVELELESTSAFVLLLFIVPLAFTLSVFLFWIMLALNTTMTGLQSRKQFYKLGMFRRLYYILLSLVAMIGVFFVVSSLSFSNRLQQNYAAETWRTRWLLLDGYLALLYLLAFAGVIYIWRPTEHNRRLAMSEELAQDEADAAEYDLTDIQMHGSEQHINQDGARYSPVEQVVFDIGDDDHPDHDVEERNELPR